jgi:hypothetical protein
MATDECYCGFGYYNGSWTDSYAYVNDDDYALHTIEITFPDDTTGVRLYLLVESTATSGEKLSIDDVQLLPMGTHNEHNQQFIDNGTGTIV